jgi:hypothetical protein
MGVVQPGVARRAESMSTSRGEAPSARAAVKPSSISRWVAQQTGGSFSTSGHHATVASARAGLDSDACLQRRAVTGRSLCRDETRDESDAMAATISFERSYRHTQRMESGEMNLRYRSPCAAPARGSG